jgi:hypothetical protein
MSQVVLQLTWDGLEAAVDLLTAVLPRDVEVACGMDRGGKLLSWALSERLDLVCMPRPVAGAVLLYGVVEQKPRMRAADAVVWAWVDATPEQSVQSVVKASAGTEVRMPWQDAVASPRQFLPGLDD